MDLNKLKAFHAVAQLGRIGDAASELKINQSSISLSISALEADLEKKLFKRHYKGMSLTQDGEILYKTTNKIFAELEVAVSKISSKDKEVKGQIIISTSYGISISIWFIKKISLFLKNNPMIKVKIIDYKPDDMENISADVFICPYINGLHGFEQEKIKSFYFKLFASKSYVKEYGFPKNYQDLDNHRLLAFSKELKNPFNDADSILHIGRQQHNPRDIFLEVSNSRSILEFVKEGLGIAVIDTDECIDPELISILDNENTIIKDSYFVYSKSKEDNKKIALLKKYFSV